MGGSLEAQIPREERTPIFAPPQKKLPQEEDVTEEETEPRERLEHLPKVTLRAVVEAEFELKPDSSLRALHLLALAAQKCPSLPSSPQQPTRPRSAIQEAGAATSPAPQPWLLPPGRGPGLGVPSWL